jgi:hypothetical protein
VSDLRPPDKSGVARAWRVERTVEMEANHMTEFGYPPVQVGPTWLVNGPYHPLWSWWYVSCISLRDVPGVPPANKRYPEAEYELIVFSLNPDPKPPRPKVPDLDALAAGDATRGLPGFLHPPDVVFQFHGVSEQQAEQILELAVDRIVAGQSCDSDFRSWWTAALESTVEHYRNGRHA